MRVQYLKDGSQDAPLIRIFGTNRSALATFQQELQMLSEGRKHILYAKDVPHFILQDIGSLTLEAGDSDQGVLEESLGNFEWIQTKASWHIIAQLVLPFLKPTKAEIYQWLTGENSIVESSASSISILLSLSETGTW